MFYDVKTVTEHTIAELTVSARMKLTSISMMCSSGGNCGPEKQQPTAVRVPPSGKPHPGHHRTSCNGAHVRVVYNRSKSTHSIDGAALMSNAMFNSMQYII